MIWTDAAACRDTNPDLFFPGEHEYGTAVEAKRICAGCPVRQDCLDAHLWEDYGIFGGTSPKERRVLRRGKQRPPKPICRHDYPSGIEAHRRRGELPCAICLDARSRWKTGIEDSV